MQSTRANTSTASQNVMDKYKLDESTHNVVINRSKELGKGAYGAVFLGKIDNNDTAFKTVQVTAKTSLDDIKREITIMAELTDSSAPYTVKLMYHNFSITNGDCIIGMNYAAHGSLEKYFPRLKGNETFNVIFGLAKALEHMHRYNIIHCDLKAENVLLDASFNPFLCDFGLSKRIGIDFFGKPVGTPLFRAVELFQNNGLAYNPFIGDYDYIFTASNTKEADIYSLHMTFCQILLQAATNNLLNHLKSFDQLINYVNTGKRLNIPASPQCTQKMADLITWGWAQAPGGRPTASQVVNKLEEIRIEMDASNQPKPN